MFVWAGIGFTGCGKTLCPGRYGLQPIQQCSKKEWPLGPEVRFRRVPIENIPQGLKAEYFQFFVVWAKAHTYPDQEFFRSL
jgi:hypothetical protein